MDKDYLTKHFTIECNKCKERNVVTMSIDEDYFKEILTACHKCGNSFKMNLEGFNLGYAAATKLHSSLHSEDILEKLRQVRRDTARTHDIKYIDAFIEELAVNHKQVEIQEDSVREWIIKREGYREGLLNNKIKISKIIDDWFESLIILEEDSCASGDRYRYTKRELTDFDIDALKKELAANHRPQEGKPTTHENLCINGVDFNSQHTEVATSGVESQGKRELGGRHVAPSSGGQIHSPPTSIARGEELKKGLNPGTSALVGSGSNTPTVDIHSQETDEGTKQLETLRPDTSVNPLCNEEALTSRSLQRSEVFKIIDEVQFGINKQIEEHIETLKKKGLYDKIDPRELILLVTSPLIFETRLKKALEARGTK